MTDKKIYTQNSTTAFLCTSSEQSENKIKETLAIKIASAVIKRLGITLLIKLCKRSVRLIHWEVQNIVERKEQKLR